MQDKMEIWKIMIMKFFVNNSNVQQKRLTIIYIINRTSIFVYMTYIFYITITERNSRIRSASLLTCLQLSSLYYLSSCNDIAKAAYFLIINNNGKK